MSEQINLTVNGVKRTLNIAGWENLIDILRDRLELTGTKRGCDDLSCGACVVVVNGEAKTSCALPAKKVDGAEIITIEHLAGDGNLHPVQQALIDAGAVQCGYCMPGIAMRLYALFNKNPKASQDEIIESLSHHLCRCTGYETILEGAELAQKYLKNKKNKNH